jgi:hypothetical protein
MQSFHFLLVRVSSEQETSGRSPAADDASQRLAVKPLGERQQAAADVPVIMMSGGTQVPPNYR